MGAEPAVLSLLQMELKAQAFRVVTTATARDALRLAEQRRPDIMLIDVLTSDMTGLELMRQIKQDSNLPVILFAATASVMDTVHGLDLGADDYIVTPFNPDEVSARVRAVLRRSVSPHDGQPVVRAGDLEIDLTRRLVRRGGSIVQLTRTELLLLEHLAANAGRVLLSGELLTKVWGPDFGDDLQYLRVWISRLRRKLELDPGNPEIIKTVPGIGYLLDAHRVGE